MIKKVKKKSPFPKSNKLKKKKNDQIVNKNINNLEKIKQTEIKQKRKKKKMKKKLVMDFIITECEEEGGVSSTNEDEEYDRVTGYDMDFINDESVF